MTDRFSGVQIALQLGRSQVECHNDVLVWIFPFQCSDMAMAISPENLLVAGMYKTLSVIKT